MSDAFNHIPNHFEIQKICENAAKEDSSSLRYVPDWFVTRELVDMWYDEYYFDDGDHWHDDEDKYFE